MKENKIHPAAELAAYKMGILKTDLSKDEEEKYIRLIAEFDNYKKRSSRQFADLIKNANEELILELLNIVDDFERALEALLPPKAENKSEESENTLSGMRLIYEKFLSVLKSKGVEVIEALGHPFDPNYHEAVMQVPTNEHDEGVVINVVSSGYMLNGKVIRHAKVIVASSK